MQHNKLWRNRPTNGSHSYASKRNLPRQKLMVPGPVELHQTVLDEMGSQVVPHFGSKWADLFKNTINRLKRVFNTDGDVFLLVSSGTGGIEAAIRSMFAVGEQVVVASNGFFGQRLVTIAQSTGLKVIEVRTPWGRPVEPQQVENALKNNHEASGVIAVHHETSTGVLNPIREIGIVSQKFSLPFVVDAVSSLGGEHLDMDNWGIDVCVSVSNKSLEAPAGLAPIAVSRNAWKVMDSKESSLSAGWYLNLRVWRQHAEMWNDWHPFPVTMPTNNVLALDAALDQLETEGVSGRIARYRNAAKFLRQELQSMGFELFVDGEFASSTITVAYGRPNMNIKKLISFLEEAHQIRIAGGLGEINGKVFRVAHMGKASSTEYLTALVHGLTEYK